ncbi:MAG TPA: response regulator transcription factor [Chitinophagaceae bacterium]
MKILLIEDEKGLADDMADYLSSQQYHCEFAADYHQATEKINVYSYDCIVLDLMLPGGDGLKLLDLIKHNRKQDGVIIISARHSIDDKIKGLQAGADDYLAKPFHLSELAARVYAVIRRKQFGANNIIDLNEISIDLLAKTVAVNNMPVPLTKKEFELLLLFAGNKNKVISKSALAEHLSGDMADMLDNHDFVYAHIKNLKRKLGESASHLKTVYGTGYKWEQ